MHMLSSDATFSFHNSVAPRYVESLLLQLNTDNFYSYAQMEVLLRSNGLDIKGHNIVSNSVRIWSRMGLGTIEKRKINGSPRNVFHLTKLGGQVISIYSTNTALFFDVMHFLFYSPYTRSPNVIRGMFWLYKQICDTLWEDAPMSVDTVRLTNRLQLECKEAFPMYDPSFTDRSVRGVFPWLHVLTPSFIEGGTKKLSARRLSCTAQLFYLATDFVYRSVERLEYGTSLAINQPQIEAICKVCLLDPEQFWNMVSLTQMTISGFEVRQGQWEKAIVLDHAPDWISLPDFSAEQEMNDLEEEDEG